MRRNLLLVVSSLLLYCSTAAAAGPPDELVFPARQGAVTFNHKEHVKGNIGCKTCHDRKGGKIKGLGKEWAHKVCKGCHEAIMVGPVVCDGCHTGAKR